MKYVHKDVYLVCTNGLKKGKLDVADRKVMIVNHKLIATNKDKPIDLTCKWIAIVMAVLAAFVLAFFMAAIVAALLATLIAILGTNLLSALGVGLCNKITQGTDWQNVHPKVRIKGINPLLENSTLPCPLGGTVFIFFDKDAAEKQATAFAVKNYTEVLIAAGGGAFLGANASLLFNSNIALNARLFGVGFNMGLMGLYSTINPAVDKLLSPYSEGLGKTLYSNNNDGDASIYSKTKDEQNKEYKNDLYPFDEGPIAPVRDAGKALLPDKMNEKVFTRNEKRAEYLRKPKGSYDKNGTYRRDRSLREKAKAETESTKGMPREERLAQQQSI
ncbi:MAG: DUF4280 domain-containing protein, partial [Niabella sp.]|nr:DUF4280 domain-containing protein [Niabella sp.]